MIYYERPDIKGPKFCEFSKVILTPENVENMKEILSKSNGILGTVKKVRNLYILYNLQEFISIALKDSAILWNLRLFTKNIYSQIFLFMKITYKYFSGCNK